LNGRSPLSSECSCSNRQGRLPDRSIEPLMGRGWTRKARRHSRAAIRTSRLLSYSMVAPRRVRSRVVVAECRGQVLRGPDVVRIVHRTTGRVCGPAVTCEFTTAVLRETDQHRTFRGRSHGGEAARDAWLSSAPRRLPLCEAGRGRRHTLPPCSDACVEPPKTLAQKQLLQIGRSRPSRRGLGLRSRWVTAAS